MNTGNAIFLGLTLIALAIIFNNEFKPANAGFGNFMGVGINSELWLVETNRGAMKRCWINAKNNIRCDAWKR